MKCTCSEIPIFMSILN